MTDPIAALRKVATGLGPLTKDVVFVGGAVAPLLITDLGSEGVRPTDDVDLIVDPADRGSYDRLGSRLRERQFKNDTSEGAPICRYVYEGVPVDVMPADPRVLGFSNRWYRYALESSDWVDIGRGLSIRVVAPVAFVATKVEAFQSETRVNSRDVLASHDLEDVVAVLDGRPTFEDELSRAPDAVRYYLAAAFAALADDDDFVGAIEGHLPPGPTRTERAVALLELIRRVGSEA